MQDFSVTAFKYGVVNNIEPQSIPDGAASSSLNWITKGDKIELRRGSIVIGTEVAGTGRITGLHISRKADGSEVAFCSRGKSVYYFDDATDLWVEMGTDVLGTSADGEDVMFHDYQTTAGAQMWFSSPHSSLFKVMVANPGSYTDMYDSTKNYKGYLKISQNRMFMWGLVNDKTGLYMSYIDRLNSTTVTAENRHNGDGSTKTFTGTLAFKSGDAKRTCFGVTFTDTTETFTDDYCGNLTGSLGGTGTINYTSGAYSITFNTAPIVGVNNIKSTYAWEMSNNNGISDFTYSATRTAGQGDVQRQDDGGGALMNVFPIGGVEYCFHEKKTWAFTATADDTAATNDVFRFSVGIPYMRAAVASSVGIFYIDVTDESNPIFSKLGIVNGSNEVTPQIVTQNINLSGYVFNECSMKEWNDYIIFTGATNDSSEVNRMFIYSKTWKSIDILDYYPSCLEIWNGTLVLGESITNNVITAFSGFDDSDSLMTNYWEGNISELGLPGRMKKVKKLIFEGEIQSNQAYNIYVSTDRGGYSLVGTISGTGSYVDTGTAILVGSNTVGSREIGGGGDGVEAYHYMHEIRPGIDRFENRKIKIEATGLGYVSITKIVDHDIRQKNFKIPSKYR